MNELQDIAEKLKDKKPVRADMTVRDLLAIFGQGRRGYRVVTRIRKELRRHQLITRPDFENENINNMIRIALDPKKPVRKIVRSKVKTGKAQNPEPSQETTSAKVDESTLPTRPTVVTIRQGIPEAGKAPATVRPNTPTKTALSRLMSENLDLLVVQNGNRARVEGIFSYASFTHAHMAGKITENVSDCINREFIEVNEEKALIDAVRDIVQHGTVVVRSRDSQLCGVVTAREVAPVFVDLAEPFILLGQIENHMRVLLERAKLGNEAYKTLVVENDPDRKARTKGVDDLTLGELILAFESEDIWNKVGLMFDKATFTKQLHRVREIRNKVMHFSPDALPADDIEKLKSTRELLEKL